MARQLFRQRPHVTIPQIIIMVIITVGLLVAIDINRRNQIGQSLGGGEFALEEQVGIELTRQVELQATLAFVQSDDYVASYARNEAGLMLSGESRVVPLLIEADPEPTPIPPPEPDPALDAQPWQAWWQLLTDEPLPNQNR